MSRRLDDVIRYLDQTDAIDEFIAVERDSARVEQSVLGTDRMERQSIASEIDMAVFRDMRRGRGSGRARLGGEQRDARELIATATADAARAVGPSWSLPPPAAPARVDVADPMIQRDLLGASRALAADTDALLGNRSELAELRARRLTISVEHTRTTVRTSHGFTYSYPSTLVGITATLGPVGANAAQGPGEPIALCSRRIADLDIAAALGRAAARLAALTAARPLDTQQPMVCDLVITDRALLPRRVSLMSGASTPAITTPSTAQPLERYGWLVPLVAQADARRVRRGLSRYRSGQPICSIEPTDPGAGDPVELVSDGTVPFGLLSAPLGDLGEPVRRFSLIRGSVAMDPALDLREAALARSLPNGGVRNLELGTGTATPAALREPAARPLIEAVSLSWLELDAQSGAFVAHIQLGYLRTGTSRGAPITDATIRGNLYALLPTTRLSTESIVSGWYSGPEAIRLNGVVSDQFVI